MGHFPVRPRSGPFPVSPAIVRHRALRCKPATESGVTEYNSCGGCISRARTFMLRRTGTIRTLLALFGVALLALSASAEQTWEQKLAERRQWWSLQPVVRPDVPDVRDGAWSDHPIDRF